MIADYVVIGMSCDHCVHTVSREVRELDGVTAVTVDLESGALEVMSDRVVGRAAIAAVLEEAGYSLADA